MIIKLMKMEIRRGYLSMLIWSISISVMIFLIIILYPMVIDIYASMPADIQDLMAQFGGIPDNILEYFATEGAIMMQIFGAIFAALLGFNMIARVEKEKVAEVLYTMPITKYAFYMSKIIVIAMFILIFSVINYGIGYLGFVVANEAIDFGQYITFSTLNMMMYIVIAYLGLFLALILKIGTNSMIAIAIPLPFYIMTLLATLTETAWLKNFKYFSPFTFADPVEILKTAYDFEWISFVIFISLTIISLCVGYILYRKRVSLK